MFLSLYMRMLRERSLRAPSSSGALESARAASDRGPRIVFSFFLSLYIYIIFGFSFCFIISFCFYVYVLFRFLFSPFFILMLSFPFSFYSFLNLLFYSRNLFFGSFCVCLFVCLLGPSRKPSWPEVALYIFWEIFIFMNTSMFLYNFVLIVNLLYLRFLTI